MRLYDELADWFHLLTHPDDYAEEAAVFQRLLTEHARRPIETVLELGCGGGNNASHLKAQYRLTLTDLSERMVEVSRALNPECDHAVGDMRTLRLGRTFDAVFIHDAIAYITTPDDLGEVFETAAAHLEPGGTVLIVPDAVAETFDQTGSSGGHDDGQRSLRYEETDGPLRPDGTYEVRFTITLREGSDERVIHDTHTVAAFPTSTWLERLDEAGFDTQLTGYRHSEVADEITVFVGTLR